MDLRRAEASGLCAHDRPIRPGRSPCPGSGCHDFVACVTGLLVGALAIVGPVTPAGAADTLVAAGTLSLPATPLGVVVDPPSNRAFVVMPGAVQAVDVATMTAIGSAITISVGSYQAAVDPVRRRQFVGDFPNGIINGLDISGAGAPVLIQQIFGLGGSMGGLDVNPIDGRVCAATEAGCKCVRPEDDPSEATVAFPPALLRRVARYLDGAASTAEEGATPPGFDGDPKHLAQTFRDDATTLRIHRHRRPQQSTNTPRALAQRTTGHV